MQLPRLDYKNAMHFYLLSWGHPLLESSCHTESKPKLTQVKRAMERLHVDILANHLAEVPANN